MSLYMINSPPYPVVPPETSGDGVLQRVWNGVIRISGALTIQGTTGAETPSLQHGELFANAEQTNSGLGVIDTAMTPSTAIAELRRRSGLTWEQLARLFGVARRSVHFWASGKALNAANEERLHRILAVVRYIDRGTAQTTRSALMTALSDGTIPVDLLAEDKFEEVKERLGAGSQPLPPRTPLSADSQAIRMPPSPDQRVGALHETVHREIGKSRGAKTVKIKSKQ